LLIIWDISAGKTKAGRAPNTLIDTIDLIEFITRNISANVSIRRKSILNSAFRAV
jgi:hypothetical protein